MAGSGPRWKVLQENTPAPAYLSASYPWSARAPCTKATCASAAACTSPLSPWPLRLDIELVFSRKKLALVCRKPRASENH